jgi:predicted aspartyl protease
MHNAERYPFVPIDVALGEASFRPCLPVTLVYQQNSVAIFGLLDTGASVNVLPHSVGIELGYVWEQRDRTFPVANYRCLKYST